MGQFPLFTTILPLARRALNRKVFSIDATFSLGALLFDSLALVTDNWLSILAIIGRELMGGEEVDFLHNHSRRRTSIRFDNEPTASITAGEVEWLH